MATKGIPKEVIYQRGTCQMNTYENSNTKDLYKNIQHRSLGRVAIVTGSGRGLGAATALRLAQEGADVCVNDLNGENATRVAAEIKGLGRKAIVSQHDVSKQDQAKAMVDETKAQLGRIDILVNNAGIT